MLGAMHEVTGQRTIGLRARPGRRFRGRPCPVYAGKNRARLAERKSCMTNFETTAADQTVREMDVEEFDLVIRWHLQWSKRRWLSPCRHRGCGAR